MPSAPLVFGYERSPSSASDSRIRWATWIACAKPVARLRRIEVEDDVVRAVGLVHPRVPRVHVDAVHLHHPHECRGLVDEREVDESRLARAWPGPKLPRRDPRGLALRRLLVEVRLAVDAVWIALQGDGPVAQVRDDHVSDLEVVLREIPLRYAIARVEDAFGMCEPHCAASDLDQVVTRHRHRMHCGAPEWRPRSRFPFESSYGMRM